MLYQHMYHQIWTTCTCNTGVYPYQISCFLHQYFKNESWKFCLFSNNHIIPKLSSLEKRLNFRSLLMVQYLSNTVQQLVLNKILMLDTCKLSSPVKLFLQVVILLPSVNVLLLTPHWTPLGALYRARRPGVCCLLLLLCCLLLQNILTRLNYCMDISHN